MADSREIRSSSSLSPPSSLQGGFFRSSNMSVLSAEEIKLVEILLDEGQQHVFDGWERAGVNDDKKHAMMRQVMRLEKGYPGGLKRYLSNARSLLVDARAGTNPFDGWRPEVPSGTQLEPNSWSFSSFESAGLAEISKTGFVLVAGGLGERLGYSGIKIGLPVESVSKTTYLEHYCKQIKAMQDKYCKVACPWLSQLPLAIMVSGDTEAGTRKAVDAVKSWFPNITIMVQEKVAALTDNSASLSMAGPYEVDTKPHGHGDVHSLMFSTGTAEAWRQRGIKWCVFFQDTNALAFHTLPAMLGVSASLDLDVNSLAVPRKAKQAVGAISKLAHADGRTMMVNVEYNQLDPLLRATTSPDGDVNDASTGLSPFPGNINQLVFKLGSYCDTLTRTQGVLAEFVNPKYADASKDKFKKPTRLECMMQDYPKVLPSSSPVGFTTAPSWLCYSPCKNNAKDAAESAAQGVPASAAWTAECDQYFCKAEMLRLLGVHAPPGPEIKFQGIAACSGPRVVIDPSTAIFFSDLKQVFPTPSQVTISARSTLAITGNVVIESLWLDGRLRIEAEKGKKIIVRAGRATERRIVNAGDELVDLDLIGPSSRAGFFAGYSEVDRMRGFIVRVADELLISTNAAAGGIKPEAGTEGVESGDGEGVVFIFTGRALVPLAAYDSCDLLGDDVKACLNI